MSQVAQPAISKSEHLTLLKLALEASLVARTEHDTREKQRRAKRSAQFKLMRWSYFGETPDEKIRLEAVARDPVRYALPTWPRRLPPRTFSIA